MLGIRCQQVTKTLGGTRVLTGVDWCVDPGVMTGLVGLSATGKTTLLRIIAGLDSCTTGNVRLMDGSATEEQAATGCGELKWNSHAPRIGFTFQNLGLWPHLTVRQHVACVLPRTEARNRDEAEALLEEVGLPNATWSRRPAELSGGEAQRLALARALAVKPQLLLLDEPLAQLDAVWRGELLDVIGQTARRRRSTVLYVTHAWEELAAFCQRAAVLDQGRIVQEGTTPELFQRPVNPTVARLTGPVVELKRTWLECGAVLGAVRGDGLDLTLRPQSLRIVEASGNSRWSVALCRPHGGNWWAELVLLTQLAVSHQFVGSQEQRLGLPVPHPLDRDAEVGVAIDEDWLRFLL